MRFEDRLGGFEELYSSMTALQITELILILDRDKALDIATLIEGIDMVNNHDSNQLIMDLGEEEEYENYGI
jgi:hypothetical protein